MPYTISYDKYCKKIKCLKNSKDKYIKNENISKKKRMAHALTVSGSSKRIVSKLIFKCL